MRKHLYAIQANFSHLFSYPEFCEMVLSIPKFLQFAATDKKTLIELNISRSSPVGKRKYMFKGYTTKIIPEEQHQSYLLRGWQFGKGKKKRNKKD
jgi:hypothetical protein